MSTPASYFPPVFHSARLMGKNGFQINGAHAGDQAGWSMDMAYGRNVWNQSVPVIAIGAYSESPLGRNNAGTARLLFGDPDVGGNGTVELYNINGLNGGLFMGAQAGDEAGFSVKFLDHNGSGELDLAVSSLFASSGGFTTGAVCVVPEVLNLTVSNNGITDMADCPTCKPIYGQPGQVSGFGWALAATNYDKKDEAEDLVVAAPLVTLDGVSTEGETAVILGKEGAAPSTIMLPVTSTNIGYSLRNTPVGSQSGFSIAAVHSALFIGVPLASFGNKTNTGWVIGLYGAQGNISNPLQDLSHLNASTSLIIFGPIATTGTLATTGTGIGTAITDASDEEQLAVGIELTAGAPDGKAQAGLGYVVKLPRTGSLDLASFQTPDDGIVFEGANPGERWGRTVRTGNRWDASGKSGYVVTRYIVDGYATPTEVTIAYIFPGNSNLLASGRVKLSNVVSDGINCIQVNTTYQGGYVVVRAHAGGFDVNKDKLHDVGFTLSGDSPNNKPAAGKIIWFYGDNLRVSFGTCHIQDDGTPQILDGTIVNITSPFDPSLIRVTIKTNNGFVSLVGSNTPQSSYNYSQILSGFVQARSSNQLPFSYSVNATTPGWAIVPEQAGSVQMIHIPRAPLYVGSEFVLKQGRLFVFNLTQFNISNPDLYQATSTLRLNISNARNMRVGYGVPSGTIVIATLNDIDNGLVSGEVDDTGLPPSFDVSALNDHNQTNVEGAKPASIVFIYAPTIQVNSTSLSYNQGNTFDIKSNILRIFTYPGVPLSQARVEIHITQGGQWLKNGVVSNSFTAQDEASGIVRFRDDIDDYGPRITSVTVFDDANQLQSGPYSVVFNPQYNPQTTKNSLVITQYGIAPIFINATQIGNPNPGGLTILFVNAVNGQIVLNVTGVLIPTNNATVAESLNGKLLFSNSLGAGKPSYLAKITDGARFSAISTPDVDYTSVNFMQVINKGMSLVQQTPVVLSRINFSILDPSTIDTTKIIYRVISQDNIVFSRGGSISSGGTPTTQYTQYDIDNGAITSNPGDNRPTCVIQAFSETTSFPPVEFSCDVSFSKQPTTPSISGGASGGVITVARGGIVPIGPDALVVYDRNTAAQNLQLTFAISDACQVMSNATGILRLTTTGTYADILLGNTTAPTLFLRHLGSVSSCPVLSVNAFNGQSYSQTYPVTVNVDFYYNPPTVTANQLTLLGGRKTFITQNGLFATSERPGVLPGSIIVSARLSPFCHIEYRSLTLEPPTWLQQDTITGSSIALVSDNATEPCSMDVSFNDNGGNPNASISVPADIFFTPAATPPGNNGGDSSAEKPSFNENIVVALEVTGVTTAIGLVVWGIRELMFRACIKSMLAEKSIGKTKLVAATMDRLQNARSNTKCGRFKDKIADRYYAAIANIINKIAHAIKTEDTGIDALSENDIGILATVIESNTSYTLNGKLGCLGKTKVFFTCEREVHHRAMKINANRIAEAIIEDVVESHPELLRAAYRAKVERERAEVSLNSTTAHGISSGSTAIEMSRIHLGGGAGGDVKTASDVVTLSSAELDRRIEACVRTTVKTQLTAAVDEIRKASLNVGAGAAAALTFSVSGTHAATASAAPMSPVSQTPLLDEFAPPPPKSLDQ